MNPYRRRSPPLPPCPTEAIVVPEGCVLVLAGRLLTHEGSPIGILLSDDVAMIQRRFDLLGHHVVREQLVGFLYARHFHIVRVDIRFPPRSEAQLGPTPAFQWERCVRYWIRHFLTAEKTGCQSRLDPGRVLDSGMEALECGADFWRDMLAILRSLQDHHPAILHSLAPEVAEAMRWWEIYIARLQCLCRTELRGWIPQEMPELIAVVDIYWKQCLRYLPGYVVLPATHVRLT